MIIDWNKISDKFNFSSSFLDKNRKNESILETEYQKITAQLQETLTIKQLNELTSDLNELLISSWIRNPNSFQITISDNQSTIPSVLSLSTSQWKKLGKEMEEREWSGEDRGKV